MSDVLIFWLVFRTVEVLGSILAQNRLSAVLIHWVVFCTVEVLSFVTAQNRLSVVFYFLVGWGNWVEGKI